MKSHTGSYEAESALIKTPHPKSPAWSLKIFFHPETPEDKMTSVFIGGDEDVLKRLIHWAQTLLAQRPRPVKGGKYD